MNNEDGKTPESGSSKTGLSLNVRAKEFKPPAK
jgi:hypothetical protein